VPRSYAVTVPDSWALIPLQPGPREKAISALARRQFAGIAGAAGVKAALRRHLTDLAEGAWQAGGIEFYLSLMHAGPLPVPASLLITLIPPPPSGPLPMTNSLLSRNYISGNHDYSQVIRRLICIYR
jgi:hypothetical protein